MKKKIYFCRKFPEIARKILEEKFDIDENKNDQILSKEFLAEIAQNYDGVITTLSDNFDSQVLSFTSRLQVISNYAVGLDNIDQNFAKSKNIKVYNLPDIVTHSTADLTFALFLSFVRQIPNAQKYVKDNLWKKIDINLFLGNELFGKTFGIIGFGRIGMEVAKRAQAFGMKILAFRRNDYDIPDSLKDSLKKASFEEILEKSDYISIHTPLTDETRGMIDMFAFEKMKETCVLINTSRGSVINTEDLLTALKEKKIKAALLDVVDPEPINNNPLLDLDNCYILPHIGTATVECRENMAKKAAENILDFFN